MKNKKTRTWEEEKVEEMKMKIGAEELLAILIEISKMRKFQKLKPYRTFTVLEARFMKDLFFTRYKGLVFNYLVDWIVNYSIVRKMPMFNSPNLRRLEYIKYFIGSKSAKEAAIKAGFSPKTAKQQASRILREIWGQKRRY